MSRQMFANGGQVRRMQAGGSPMMPAAPQQTMAPPPSMAGMPPPEIESMAQASDMPPLRMKITRVQLTQSAAIRCLCKSVGWN